MISVIINYSSLEEPFLKPLLNECLKFSDDIIVSFGTHLYNGTKENISIIIEYQKLYNTVQFVPYRVDTNLDLYIQVGVNERPVAYWHNLARYTGFKKLKNKEWVLIIDSDEIPEGDKFKQWLSETKLNISYIYKLACYWYFKSPIFQSIDIQDSPLLIHYSHLNDTIFFGDWERDHIIRETKLYLNRFTKSADDQILFHHYSWVRSIENLEKKITSWGHNNDFNVLKGKSPKDIIQYIFKDNNVNDIIYNYNYNITDNRFNISL